MRKMLRVLFVALGLLWASLGAWAQERTITGRVTDEASKPLAGVTVRVKGTPKIAVTAASGTFSLVAKSGDVLQFSYVGRRTSELTVGNGDVLDLQMGNQDAVMNEVVVTAMDIRRNPRELGYSTQTVSGKDVQESQRENFVNSLQGRVAGLTVTPTSGLAGASSGIVLRGFNSLSLDNSPLFVIDGIIVDNSSVSENNPNIGFGSRPNTAPGTENRGNDYTNRIADINPNDIESITVLKGPEATALYGSQASSGAIIITTKKSSSTGRVNVAYDNSFRTQRITRFTEFQRRFRAGSNGVPESTFSFFGPDYEPTATRYLNAFENFLETGFAQTHNLSADFGSKVSSFRFSGSFFDQQGSVPTNNYKRYNLRLSNNTRIGSMLEIQPSISYIRSTNTKPLRGAGGYMLSFFSWPSEFDITDYQTDGGLKKPLYNANPNAEIDNPYYNVYRNRSEDETDRLIGTLGINFNPFKFLSVAGRFGYDTYQTDGYTRYDSMSSNISRPLRGAQTNYYRRYYGYNHTITATLRHTIGNFSGRLLVGNMWQDYETQMTTVYGTNLNDFKSGDSAATDPTTRLRNINMFRKGLPNYSINRQSAYFGEASVSWNNAIFLTYSHRFEESSIFPKQFRSYNYPAGSVSVMVSELIPSLKQSKTFNYFKLRGSLASTARSGAPYANQSIFDQNIGSGGGFRYGFTNANEFLQPERQKTYEVGTEMRFFNGRFNIDATYYDTRNSNLIVENFRASYGTGFVLNTLNVGSNKNTGIEIALDAVPVQSKSFRWSTRLNFNRMRNKVTSLPANVPEFYISDTWLIANANVRGGLVVGGPTTSITGYGYARNDAGQILITPTTGLPVTDATFKVRGDRNPDYTLGILNNFSYKGLRFNMLWDLKVGGDIVNGNDYYLTRNGRSLRSEDRLTPRVIEGVLNDGLQNTATPTRNTITVTPYYNQLYYQNMPEEEFIERDVNWLRLRDVTLSYGFPSRMVSRLKYFKNLSVFLTANDIVLITNYTGADPASSGVSAGSRGVGAFGFDYGNVATPVSFNLGLRANF